MKSPPPDLAGNDLFSDPLLRPGETLEAPNLPPEPPQGPRFSDDGDSSAFESSSSAPKPADPRFRRKRTSISTVPSERPDWLPSDWIVEDRTRTSGATAGTVDKYYFDPVSGRRFRSKKEVMFFFETGSVRKKKMSENPESDATPSESPAGKRQKKSSTKKKSAPLNFDFQNVPEKIKWVLTDSAEETWSPFAGKVKVPESTKQDWEAAFTSLTMKKGRKITF